MSVAISDLVEPRMLRPTEALFPPFSELAEVANREHRLAREAAVSMVEHAVRCGEVLAEVKSQLPHGEWLPWADANFEGSARTAQGYMRLAREFAANPQRAAHLSELSFRQAMEAVSSGPVESKERNVAKSAFHALKGAPVISGTEELRRYMAWRIEQFSDYEIRTLPFVQELVAENRALRRRLAAAHRRQSQNGARVG